eukprot:TRINITY_DN2859_c0_g1_i1.p1 TRINITY_DN2859_c0_g1~~TRINITY_DN2859_c0_g1_i1.p1  ORF type:complete len:832 (-),score=182.48 TRINITY_DN2859_c0_g1_i1:373-2868(-)
MRRDVGVEDRTDYLKLELVQGKKIGETLLGVSNVVVPCTELEPERVYEKVVAFSQVKKGSENQPVVNASGKPLEVRIRLYLSSSGEVVPDTFQQNKKNDLFYDKYKKQFKTGDLIAYNSIGFMPSLVKLLSGANTKVSKLGIIICLPNKYTKKIQHFVIEWDQNSCGMQDAFKESFKDGLNIFRLEERLHHFHGEEIYWVPLLKPLNSNITTQLEKLVWKHHDEDVDVVLDYMKSFPLPPEFPSLFERFEKMNLKNERLSMFELFSARLVSEILRQAGIDITHSTEYDINSPPLTSRSFAMSTTSTSSSASAPAMLTVGSLTGVTISAYFYSFFSYLNFISPKKVIEQRLYDLPVIIRQRKRQTKYEKASNKKVPPRPSVMFNHSLIHREETFGYTNTITTTNTNNQSNSQPDLPALEMSEEDDEGEADEADVPESPLSESTPKAGNLASDSTAASVTFTEPKFGSTTSGIYSSDEDDAKELLNVDIESAFDARFNLILSKSTGRSRFESHDMGRNLNQHSMARRATEISSSPGSRKTVRPLPYTSLSLSSTTSKPGYYDKMFAPSPFKSLSLVKPNIQETDETEALDERHSTDSPPDTKNGKKDLPSASNPIAIPSHTSQNNQKMINRPPPPSTSASGTPVLASSLPSTPHNLLQAKDKLLDEGSPRSRKTMILNFSLSNFLSDDDTDSSTDDSGDPITPRIPGLSPLNHPPGGGDEDDDDEYNNMEDRQSPDINEKLNISSGSQHANSEIDNEDVDKTPPLSPHISSLRDTNDEDEDEDDGYNKSHKQEPSRWYNPMYREYEDDVEEIDDTKLSDNFTFNTFDDTMWEH